MTVMVLPRLTEAKWNFSNGQNAPALAIKEQAVFENLCKSDFFISFFYTSSDVASAAPLPGHHPRGQR